MGGVPVARLCRLACGTRTRLRSTFACRLTCLSRQRAMRSRAARLLAQRRFGGTRAFPRGAAALRAFREIALGFSPGRTRRSAFRRRRQLYAGASRLGQTNRDRLLCIARTVLAFADVMHLLAHKLAGLGRSGFTFGRIAMRAFDRRSFRHKIPFGQRTGSAGCDTRFNASPDKDALASTAISPSESMPTSRFSRLSTGARRT